MDKKLAGLMSLFFLSFSIFISVLIFEKPLSRFTRAAEDSKPSSAKSLIFAWPLSSSVARSESIKVDVFIRSESGNPIPSRKVLVESTLGSLTPNNAVSDKNGKATFSLTSDTAGTADLSAVIDNTVPISQKISVRFD